MQVTRVFRTAWRAVSSCAIGVCVAVSCSPTDGPSADSVAAPADRARVVVEVLDPDGARVPGAFVSVMALQIATAAASDGAGPDFHVRVGDRRVNVMRMDLQKLHTGRDGTADALVPPAFSEVLLYAFTGTKVAFAGPVHIEPGRTTRRALRLGEGCVAIGRVTDELGTPTPGVPIEFGWVGLERLDLSQRGGWASAETEDDGTFRVGPIELPPRDGQVEVSAFATGTPFPVRVVRPAWLGESDPFDLVIRRPPR